MTTVVNTPGSGNGDNAGLGLIMGVILTIAVIALIVIFGLPMIRGTQAPVQNDTIDVNVKLPAVTGEDTPKQ